MKWELFTKRTGEPKLTWLEMKLSQAGIPYRRNGESFHAPILEVPETELERAWSILTPAIDNAPDDSARWRREIAAAGWRGAPDGEDGEDSDEYGELTRAGLDRRGRP